MHIEISKDIYWIGFVDWELRHFHGHELVTPHGSSYNSYLIMDDKVAVVDAVWTPHVGSLINNLSELVDPSKVDYIIANHAEVDHAGGLIELMKCCPNATLVCSKNGVDSLEGNYHQGWNYQVVKTGDRISLGKNELSFIEAPMLHWPDSMFTFVGGANILMPNDAFGQHFATPFRFNDEVDQDTLFDEAVKYYANILCPFSDRVLKKLDEVGKMNLPIAMIAPSHGVIWRKDPLQIVTKYAEWASQAGEKSAVIVYDTMWNATRRMADAIAEGMESVGLPYKVFNLSTGDRNDIIKEAFKARTIAVGSCTHNNGAMPHVFSFMHDMKQYRFKNKTIAAFGSYGWSGEAVKHIESLAKECGLPVIREGGVRCKWQPDENALQACRDYGTEIANATI